VFSFPALWFPAGRENALSLTRLPRPSTFLIKASNFKTHFKRKWVFRRHSKLILFIGLLLITVKLLMHHPIREAMIGRKDRV